MNFNINYYNKMNRFQYNSAEKLIKKIKEENNNMYVIYFNQNF
jgi:hypothetical protein